MTFCELITGSQIGYILFLKIQEILFILLISLFICIFIIRDSNLIFLILQEPSSVEKIMEIDEHIGCAMSGLIADARTLVEHARVETQVL